MAPLNSYRMFKVMEKHKKKPDRDYSTLYTPTPDTFSESAPCLFLNISFVSFLLFKKNVQFA